MYQVESWSALRTYWRARRGGAAGPAAVSTNVIALGVTSLLTDVSSEMVGTILPVFLVLHLGLSPLHFGFVEGVYQGMTAVLRIISGAASDRLGRFKEIALVGYGLSAVARLAMVYSGSGNWGLIATAVASDRLGKGIRVVPRDLLISLSSPPGRLATAFGVHRAFDSAGAMLGPLVALGLLAAVPSGFDLVFMVSFSIAAAGVAVLWFFVSNVQVPPREAAAAVPSTHHPRDVRHVLIRVPAFRMLTAGATLLALATIGDGFVYLILQRHAGFNPGLLPLLYVATSLCYLVMAIPAGRLADRLGQKRGLLAGYIALLACYGSTGALAASWVDAMVGITVAILALGAYYALTDGVLMAAASSLLPVEIRGSGLAWLTTLTSLARSFAAITFGALWTMRGESVALLSAGLALTLALVAATALLGQGTTRESA